MPDWVVIFISGVIVSPVLIALLRMFFLDMAESMKKVTKELKGPTPNELEDVKPQEMVRPIEPLDKVESAWKYVEEEAEE